MFETMQRSPALIRLLVAMDGRTPARLAYLLLALPVVGSVSFLRAGRAVCRELRWLVPLR